MRRVDGGGPEAGTRRAVRTGPVLSAAAGMAVALAAATLDAPAARAQLKSDQCLAQIRDAGRAAIACELTAGADDRLKARLKKETEGVVTDATCRVPVRMEKAAMRAKLGAGGTVELPELRVRCKISGAGGDAGAARASAVLRPKCVRAKPGAADAPKDKDAKTPKVKLAWTCEPNVSELEGLGMLGMLFQRLANGSDTVKYAMAKFLTEVELALAEAARDAKATDKNKAEAQGE